MKPTKKELLKSPIRAWDDTSRAYDSVLFVQGGTKHDSGFMNITIIGSWVENEKRHYEICGWADDVVLSADLIRFGDNQEYSFHGVRMDCYYPQGVFRYHGRGKFKVSEALSSMEITFTRHD